MKTHQTDEMCPVCGRAAALTTERGWIDDETFTAVLCCPDCRTLTGLVDDAVEMAHGCTEEEALSRIDADAWRRIMRWHKEDAMSVDR